MFSLNSILYSAQTLTTLKAQQKKDEALYTKRKDLSSPIETKSADKSGSLYKQRQASGYYAELSETDPELASMQQYVDRMNDEAGTVVENMLSPKPSMDTIMAKMQSGQELSPAELEHLKKTDPDLYSKAVQIAAERKAYEQKLKNCKTKEDVQRVKLTALSGVMVRVNDITNNPNIPEDKKLEMIQHEGRRAQAFNEATAEYVKTTEYAQKPTEAERNADDKAERIEREEAVNPKEDTAAEKAQEEAPKPDENIGADRTEQDGQKAETVELPELELPGQGEGPDTEPTPLPGEGKSAAAQEGASDAAFTPRRTSVRIQDAHEAYRRMTKRR